MNYRGGRAQGSPATSRLVETEPRHIAYFRFLFRARHQFPCKAHLLPMFIGHYAVAFAAKKYAPETSLGTLFASVQLVDLIWPIFLLLGVEQVRIDPGNTTFTPLDFVHYPVTHSLVGALGWSVGFGLIYLVSSRNRRNALVVGLCVASHWVLDAVVHRPDLPIVPGGETRIGLGLWNTIGGTMAVEGALFAMGIWMYMHASQPKDRLGRVGPLVLAGLLAAIYVANVMGPPPPDERSLAYVALAAWIFPFAAGWIDRRRKVGIEK